MSDRVTCPKCKSANIVEVDSECDVHPSGLVADYTFFYKCNSCGHEFKISAIGQV